MNYSLSEKQYRYFQLAILFVSAIVYLGSITGKLIWDDQFIMSGSAIGGGDSLLHCFTNTFLVNYYRPIVSASFYLEKFVSHHTPFFYHQTNILMHVATTWLVTALMWEAFRIRGLALLAGAIFAVQPVQIDAVAWIGGRTDSLCALWMALYGWSLVRAARADDVTRNRWLALATVGFALSLFTKEQMLPAALLAPLAFHCWRDQSAAVRPMGSWRSFAPFVGVCCIYMGLYIAFGPEPPDPIKIGPAAVIAQFLRTVTYYALLLVAPTPRWVNTMSLGLFARAGIWTVLSGLGVLSAFAIGFKKLLKSEPGAAWLLAFVGLTIFVVSNLWPVPSMLVAPYRAGASGIGAAGFLAWAAWRYVLAPAFTDRFSLKDPFPSVALGKNPILRPVVVAFAVGYLVWCGGITAWGARKWQNEEIAGATIVRYDPDSIWAHLNYTTALLNARKKAPAAREIEALLTKLVGPNNWRESARVLRAVDDDPQILVHIREVQGTRKDPKQWLAAVYTQLAFARMDLGQRGEAKVNFKIALTLYPQTTEALLGMGTIAHIEGDDPKAEGYLRLAVTLDYDRNESHVKLGLVLASLGKWTEACHEFVICIKQQPWVGKAYVELANAQLHLGDKHAARETLEKALRMSPNRDDIKEMLAGMSQDNSSGTPIAPPHKRQGS